MQTIFRMKITNIQKDRIKLGYTGHQLGKKAETSRLVT